MHTFKFPFLESLFVVIFFLSLVSTSSFLFTSFWYPLLDLHEFRQTQTAISVWSMLQTGKYIVYETPVLGGPWTIPFEFPTYQLLVLVLIKISNLPIDQAGRLIGILFFLSSLIPLWLILEHINIPRALRFPFLSFFISAPVYIFWSRTFLIESTALFLSLLYVALYLKSTQKQEKTLYLVCILGIGCLAAVTKITTFLPFIFVPLLITLFEITAKKREIRQLFSSTKDLIATVAIPLFVAWIWEAFTRQQRDLVPLAHLIFSKESLSSWVFGSWEQRLSSPLWLDTIANRSCVETFGSWWLCTILLFISFIRQNTRAASLTLLFLYLSSFLIFTNLHIVHAYYQYANSLFLIGIGGLAVTGISSYRKLGQFEAAILVILILQQQHQAFELTYLDAFFFKDTKILAEASEIQRITQEDESVLIYGQDWSSALPYYARRYAIMDSRKVQLDLPIFREILLKSSSHPLGAIVDCSSNTATKEHALLISTYLTQPNLKSEVAGCTFYDLRQ